MCPAPLPFPQSWELSLTTANPLTIGEHCFQNLDRALVASQVAVGDFISEPPEYTTLVAGLPGTSSPKRGMIARVNKKKKKQKHNGNTSSPNRRQMPRSKRNGFCTLQQEYFLAPGTRRFP
jgi:hypothetical protein